MKQQYPKPAGGRMVRIVVPVLFAALCALTVLMVYTIRWGWGNAGDAGEFDLARLANETRREDTDVSGYLLPEFIGLTVSGKQLGVSASYYLISELYELLTPTIGQALTAAVPLAQEMDDETWNNCTSAETSVYIRYHSELTDGVVALFAGRMQNLRFRDNIREIFILPSSEETVVAIRSASGDVIQYILPVYMTSFSANEISRFVRSYGGGMTPFIFNEETYASLAWTEPIYTETIQTRNLIMTDGTAGLIQNRSGEKEALLRLFGFNSDKLLNVHEEADGSSSYYDTEGILYLRRSSFEYLRSSEDSGLDVNDILGGFSGRKGNGSTAETLRTYVQAAVLLYENLEKINRNYTGGDADILLRSMSSIDGEVTLEFQYVLDNVPIADDRAAYRITFYNDRVLHAELHTISVRTLAERSESYQEWWFASRLPANRFSDNERLVYRSDYLSEAVSAEWAAEELNFTETEDEYGE